MPIHVYMCSKLHQLPIDQASKFQLSCYTLCFQKEPSSGSKPTNSGTAASLSSLLHIPYPHHSLLSALYPLPVESATPALTFSFQLFSSSIPSARLFIHCSIKPQIVQGRVCVVTYHGACYSELLWHTQGISWGALQTCRNPLPFTKSVCF